MEECNGWNSRETWLINVWADETPWLDERLYFAAEDGDPSIAEGLGEGISETLCEGLEGLALDLMKGALARVDWQELVETPRG